MMDFREILKELVKRSDGASAAVLMGFDGIAIEEYSKEDSDSDIQLSGIEYSTILKEMKRASDVLDGGELAEVSVITAKGMVIVRCISDEYFLMLNMTSDGNLGKARYMMKVTMPKLLELL